MFITKSLRFIIICRSSAAAFEILANALLTECGAVTATPVFVKFARAAAR
nr:MAG TPA: hypothetical protein [Caudoviricetes sp.]